MCETCGGSGRVMIVVSARFFDTIQPVTAAGTCWVCGTGGRVASREEGERLTLELAAAQGGTDLRVDYVGPEGPVHWALERIA